MALDPTKTAEIIETMEKYLTAVRPVPEIRDQVDIGYELKDQSVVIFEIRPLWNDPSQIKHYPYAKVTYVKDSDLWKVFWRRADLKWHSYTPKATVKKLSAFLKLVDEDKHYCFKG